MAPKLFRVALLALSVIGVSIVAMAQDLPITDARITELRHLNLKYDPPIWKSSSDWDARREFLRGQILFSAGLLPEPQKTPLNAKVFGRIDKGDYTVEKVYFESYPGHYVTGNLYRPRNASGKLPAVLCPHGHWAYGRLENQPLNSGPARAANFARQGFVAFAWDMVGYNDSSAISHSFASHKKGLVRESLWGINLLGLQLWNSIRSVDFLSSLPDVDPDRIGVTGESGGGTQTFLLCAVDRRIAVSSPVNMISSIMQGGSVCENAPLLRIDTNNMEIGALMAPRPMMMIAATGDWTKSTPTVEYPAVRSIYDLMGSADKVKFAQFDFPHNYNQVSREAVYGWFAKWLKGSPDFTPVKEKSANIPTIPEMLVFSGAPRPANELNEESLAVELIKRAEDQLQSSIPRSIPGLASFRQRYGSALGYSLMAAFPSASDLLINKSANGVLISRRGRNDLVRLTRSGKEDGQIALLIRHTNDSSSSISESTLVAKGYNVYTLAPFAGHTNLAEIGRIDFFDTYNRSDTANRVQDILTAISYLSSQKGSKKLIVIGNGAAGLETLAARGLAAGIDCTVVDAGRFNNTKDSDYLERFKVPGFRRAGGFLTSVILGEPTPLLIHNTGGQFDTSQILEILGKLRKANLPKVEAAKPGPDELLEWIARSIK